MTDRLWFKIGEASRLVGASPKELRYWEKLIPELRPRRSKGNLRYYHADELPRLRQIRDWLAEGLTVADCRERLTGEARALPTGVSAPVSQGGGLGEVAAALRALVIRLGGAPGSPSIPSRAQAPQRRPVRRATVPPTSKPAQQPGPERLSAEAAEVAQVPDSDQARDVGLPLVSEAPSSEPPAPVEVVPDVAERSKPRRARRSPSASPPEPLGRMWSDGRLPMDWDD